MVLLKWIRKTWQQLGHWRWLLLLTLAAAGWFGYQWRNGDDNAQVVTAPVARDDVEITVLATGTVEAAKTVDVGAQASGQIKRLFVQLGDRVQKGDLLAEIDPEVSQNALEEALANIDNLKSQQTIRQLALEESLREYERQRTMMDGDATPKKELDSALSAVKTRKAELQQIGAQLRQADLKRATAQANLGYTRILAPMDGIVVAIAAKEGQTVNANQSTPTILTLADLDTMKIKAQVAEADVIRLRDGVPLYFSILGAPERRFDAQLVGIEPLPQTVNNAVFYNALFNVPNKRGLLRPQMTAQVTFVLASARNVLTVPLSALQKTAGSKGRGNKASGAQSSARASSEQAEPLVDHASQFARNDKVTHARESTRDKAASVGEQSKLRDTNDTNPSRSKRSRTATWGENYSKTTESTVSVRTAQGKIETRKVTVGLRSAIAAEIRAGLKEGDEVVIGKVDPNASAKSPQGGQSGVRIGGTPGGRMR